MSLPLEGWSYGNGILRRPNGTVVLEIDTKENQSLDERLSRLGSIQAVPVVNGTTVTIDGDDYTVRTEDDRGDVKAIGAEIVSDLRAAGLSLGYATAVVKAIFKALRWYKKNID